MNKSTSIPVSPINQEDKHPSISISRNKIFRLHDIADGLQLLRDIMEEGPQMRLVQAHLLIKKTSKRAWNLIHEEPDNRWQECQPHVELIRREIPRLCRGGRRSLTNSGVCLLV